MSNELVVVNRLEGITFQNEYLAESVRKIIECSRNIIANHFQIAYELASIKKLELYKEDGYESVADFAEKVFGFSKTSTSMAIKVAERYLIDEGDQIATTFFDTGTDFSFNQLIETLPLSERRVNSLVFDKKLRPTMTVKQIRTLVQEEKKKGNNQSFDIETEENRGINLEVIDISANSISSSSSVQSDNLSAETPSESNENAPESTENSSRVSNYQETSQSLSTGNSSSSIYQEEEHELKLQSLSDSSSEQELKEYVKLLEEEVKRLKEENERLKEENYKLAHPIKRGRGRPKKVRD